MKLADILRLGLSTVAACLCTVGWCVVRRQAPCKKQRRQKTLLSVGAVIAIWLLVGSIINLASGRTGGLELELSLFSERVTLGGLSVARTTVLVWGMIVVVLVLALLFRFVAVPRFSDDPHGLQSLAEMAVEGIDSLCAANVEQPFAGRLAPYMMTVCVLLMGSALTELLGQRPPTADLMVNLSLSLVTLALINFCCIRKKGVGGRLKGMASPSPVLFPIKLINDMAVPISLACRLFGNMLGGMIVMDLLKGGLGGYAAGLAGVAGIYFNLIHPLIQTYVFVVLSLSFIREAVEDTEE